MKINNKEILQSYILTTAKYDYTVYEKRILYKIIERLQYLIEGKKLSEKYNIRKYNHSDLELIEFQFPFSDLKKSDEDKNHAQIKKALLSLEKKGFEYEDDEVWKTINILYFPKIEKNKDYIGFTLRNEILDAFLDFSKGFKKYELKVAMQFESVYSMRFYELFSNQKTPINYGIEKLKEMFNLSGKYQNKPTNFINKVIIPAKTELDKCSPYTFHYEVIKTGRNITGIRFIPIYQPIFASADIKNKNLLKNNTSIGLITSSNVRDYLIHNFNFTIQEIENNRDLFAYLKIAFSEDKLLDFLAEIRETSIEAKNRKAYVIGSLKKKAEEIASERISKLSN